jgi:predicted nucleic acid-binding protein
MTRAFLDANVFLYAVGRPHQLKIPSIRVLEMAAAKPEAFVTDAEVFQEILHRALSLKIWPQARLYFRDLVTLMHGRIHSVTMADVTMAADLADGHLDITARDLLHAAVMRRLGLSLMISADRGFDRISGFTRLDPLLVEDWGAMVTGS